MVIVLLLMMVALALSAGLLYLLARGGYMSGMERRYKSAYEAGVGGTDVTLQLIGTRGVLTMLPANNLVVNATLATKLASPTASWGAGVDNSVSISPDN